MPSTYSPNLRLELIANGEQAGTWGATTNTNLGTLLDSAIAGVVAVSVTSANQALTASNGAADQARNATLVLTTTTTAAFAVYAPPVAKQYTIHNSAAYDATIYNSTVLGNTTAAGTGVVIPAGKKLTVWTNGTNFSVEINHLPALSLTTDLAVADGGTGASDAATARTNLGLGTMATQAANSVAITGGSISGASVSSSSATITGGSISGASVSSSSVTITGGSITGITDLAIADGGTGASDAATARTNLGLGTMATQAAGSVAITGGSITGITDLAIADGGTGASDAATARTNLGLGTMATQASNSVSITGGSITGITDLAIADGGTGASTALAAFDNLKQVATDTYTGVVELATNAEVIAGTDTTRAMTPAGFRAGNLVLGAAVSSTSGATVDFTGIPSWVRRITVMLDGVSTNGTSPMIIRLGTSSGVETTGYSGFYSSEPTAGYYVVNLTSGIPINYTSTALAAYTYIGAVVFTKVDGNTWVAFGEVAPNGTPTTLLSGSVSGRKTLSGTLDRVQVTTIGGTNTFDAGTINVMWE